MKILHSGPVNVHSGGPALSTWLTVKGLRQRGQDVCIVASPIKDGDRIIDPQTGAVFTRPPKLGTLAYVPGLGKLLNEIADVDIYHIQGVWMLHGLAVSRYACKQHKPYVVTLRGMLYPQALAHNSLVKRLSMALYQRKILQKAAAVQCTCIEEMEHFRKLGLSAPVAVIPNPIETDGIIDEPIPHKPTFTIGYLGRLHSRKRVERLIYSMHRLRDKLPPKSRLKIIGGGDERYTRFLNSEIARLGLTNVEMTGFLSGDQKHQAIKSLSVLAVPSDFENFGNIVTEALVRGVPVIASKGMPWQELPENHCGWWIDNSQEEIDRTILECASIGEDARLKMGIKGRELILRDYSVSSLAEKMEKLYGWIIRGGETPDFVYLKQ